MCESSPPLVAFRFLSFLNVSCKLSAGSVASSGLHVLLAPGRKSKHVQRQI